MPVSYRLVPRGRCRCPARTGRPRLPRWRDTESDWAGCSGTITYRVTVAGHCRPRPFRRRTMSARTGAGPRGDADGGQLPPPHATASTYPVPLGIPSGEFRHGTICDPILAPDHISALEGKSARVGGERPDVPAASARVLPAPTPPDERVDLVLPGEARLAPDPFGRDDGVLCDLLPLPASRGRRPFVDDVLALGFRLVRSEVGEVSDRHDRVRAVRSALPIREKPLVGCRHPADY